jgi:hypothetical protein
MQGVLKDLLEALQPGPIEITEVPIQKLSFTYDLQLTTYDLRLTTYDLQLAYTCSS